MLIDGCITEVMESYPLQLTVIQGASPYHVELSENTVLVTKNGKKLSSGSLRPGLRLLITTNSEDQSSAVVAAKIVVESEECNP